MNNEITQIANEEKKIYLYWGVSSFCNLRCSYCYVPEYNKANADGLNKMAIERTDKLIDKIENSDYSLTTVTLHGAEPYILSPETIATIVPKLHDVIDHPLIGSQTNGTLLTEKYHDRMGDLTKQLKIGFTLDPKTLHDSQRENTYDLVKENMLIAVKRGYKCNALTTIGEGITDRLHEVQEIVDFCVENKIFLVMKYIHTNDGSYMMREDEKDKWVDWLYETGNYQYIQNYSPSFCINGGCYGGFYEFGVNGDVTACNKTNTKEGVFGNWITDDLNDIWEDRQKLFDDTVISNDCFNCDFYDLCHGGCPVDRDTNGHAVDCHIKRKLFYTMFHRGENIMDNWIKSSVLYRREKLYGK